VPAEKSPQKSVSPSGKNIVEKPPRIELKNQKVWEIVSFYFLFIF
jgi:hypothetical protein